MLILFFIIFYYPICVISNMLIIISYSFIYFL